MRLGSKTSNESTTDNSPLENRLVLTADELEVSAACLGQIAPSEPALPFRMRVSRGKIPIKVIHHSSVNKAKEMLGEKIRETSFFGNMTSGRIVCNGLEQFEILCSPCQDICRSYHIISSHLIPFLAAAYVLYSPYRMEGANSCHRTPNLTFRPHSQTR